MTMSAFDNPKLHIQNSTDCEQNSSIKTSKLGTEFNSAIQNLENITDPQKKPHQTIDDQPLNLDNQFSENRKDAGEHKAFDAISGALSIPSGFLVSPHEHDEI
jgi:hypothetical protein